MGAPTSNLSWYARPREPSPKRLSMAINRALYMAHTSIWWPPAQLVHLIPPEPAVATSWLEDVVGQEVHHTYYWSSGKSLHEQEIETLAAKIKSDIMRQHPWIAALLQKGAVPWPPKQDARS